MKNIPNVIYIVEDESSMPESSAFSAYMQSNSVNFTMPDNEILSSNKIEKLRAKNEEMASLALLIAARAIPAVGIIASGASVALWIKGLLKDSSDLSETEKLEKTIAENELTRFLVNHAVTPHIASEAGFSFPPGHPRSGTAYRLHPLAGHTDESKNKLYIPHENYDELLFEEREAELIKLLIKLGATRISIKHMRSLHTVSDISGSVEAGNTLLEGSITANNKNLDSSHQSWDREFLLNPEQEKIEKINDQEYAWLRFEPSWQTLLIAREYGGCTKASIELKEKTAFSSKSAASIGAKSPTLNGSVSGYNEKNMDSSHNIFIEVEFMSEQSA